MGEAECRVHRAMRNGTHTDAGCELSWRRESDDTYIYTVHLVVFPDLSCLCVSCLLCVSVCAFPLRMASRAGWVVSSWVRSSGGDVNESDK